MRNFLTVLFSNLGTNLARVIALSPGRLDMGLRDGIHPFACQVHCLLAYVYICPVVGAGGKLIALPTV